MEKALHQPYAQSRKENNDTPRHETHCLENSPSLCADGRAGVLPRRSRDEREPGRRFALCDRRRRDPQARRGRIRPCLHEHGVRRDVHARADADGARPRCRRRRAGRLGPEGLDGRRRGGRHGRTVRHRARSGNGLRRHGRRGRRHADVRNAGARREFGLRLDHGLRRRLWRWQRLGRDEGRRRRLRRRRAIQ